MRRHLGAAPRPIPHPSAVLQQSPPRRCFSFLSVSFGLITNLDIGTEHLRCDFCFAAAPLLLLRSASVLQGRAAEFMRWAVHKSGGRRRAPGTWRRLEGGRSLERDLEQLRDPHHQPFAASLPVPPLIATPPSHLHPCCG